VQNSLDALLGFLFKYPPHLFRRGVLALAPGLPVPLLIGAVIVALGILAFALRGIRTTAPGRDRLVLGAIRLVAILLLAGCLMRPVLLLSSSVPQRNILGVLLDDSRSMRLSDVNGAPRLDAVKTAFGDSAALVRRLGDRFVLRFFRFGADAGAVTGAGALKGNGTRTDLAGALQAAQDELAGAPLAGLILVTDGADNAGADLTAPLLSLRARKVPVYSVGVGQERFAKDAGIERVALPASALAGAGVMSEVAVRVRGLAGQQLDLVAEDDGRVIAERSVSLGKEDIARVRLRLPQLDAGSHPITFKIRPIPGEVVTENNEYKSVLRIRPGPEKILYVEGEPRPELAFIRRAVAGDSALQLVAMLRSAKGKYLRLGVDDSLELASGFPTRREDLFRYRAVVLGSIEASFFTGDQLRMLADFVSRRGGGLVALGGRSALAEGGYADTPLDEILPVSLRRPVNDETDPVASELAPHLTSAGKVHPILQLGATEEAASRWDSMPALTSVNPVGTVKPGATVLLEGRPTSGAGSSQPLLVVQRFGRGTVALLDVQDTWLWRMDARIPVEDRTHSTFWRQLLRWSLDGVPERLEVAASPIRVGPGEPTTLRARLVDQSYLDANDGSVLARVIAPAGDTIEVPLTWTMRGDGIYEGRYVATQPGVYRVEAEARRTDEPALTRADPSALLVDDFGADVEQPELRAQLLERIAGETGGRYYPLAQADRLADDVGYTESGVTVRESRDLWDMPIVFLLLVGLLGTEWAYRRRRGLA